MNYEIFCIFAIDYDTNKHYLLVWTIGSSLYCDLLDIFRSQGNTQLWYSQGTPRLYLARS